MNLFNVRSGLLRGVKDGHGDDNEDDNRQYCQSCLQYGIRSKLKKRMYKVEVQVVAAVADQATESESKPKPKLVPANVPDADRFRQCYLCDDIVPIYNVKYEAKIEDFVQTIDNPFDLNPSKMDVFRPTSSIRKSKSKSIYKRRREYISSIKDEDIRRELADGQTQLISYSEHAGN